MNILEKLEQRGFAKRESNWVGMKFELPMFEGELASATDDNIVQILKVRLLAEFFNIVGVCDYSLLDTKKRGDHEGESFS